MVVENAGDVMEVCSTLHSSWHITSSIQSEYEVARSAIPTLAYHAQEFRVTPSGIPLGDPEMLALFLAFRSLIVVCLSVNVS